MAGKASDKEKYMRRALKLAARGRGKVSPNPMVGAVVVKRGRIVGEGFHPAAGKPHAEVFALNAAGKSARGADLYLNLEPCSHFGRTPPCAPVVAASGVSRVFIGAADPNPLVAGRGIAFLKEKGLKVEVGLLEDECRRLNEIFFKYISSKLPFVIMKAAISLDGKLAAASGDSRWISNEAARRQTHRMRAAVDAVMVGRKTAEKDDPLLTARLPGVTRQPLRVVVDCRLRLSRASQLVKTARQAPTLVATLENQNSPDWPPLVAAGVEVLQFFPDDDGRIPLRDLLQELASRQVASVLLEGGGELFASALFDCLVDKVILFQAPIFVGGRDATPLVGGRGVFYIADAVQLTNLKVKRLKDNLVITGYPDYRNLRE